MIKKKMSWRTRYPLYQIWEGNREKVRNKGKCIDYKDQESPDCKDDGTGKGSDGESLGSEQKLVNANFRFWLMSEFLESW